MNTIINPENQCNKDKEKDTSLAFPALMGVQKQCQANGNSANCGSGRHKKAPFSQRKPNQLKQEKYEK